VHISVNIPFENIKLILTSLNDCTFIFSIENIRSHIWKPCPHTFSPAVLSKCLRIRALDSLYTGQRKGCHPSFGDFL
jgi:hypothetical protein